MVELVGTAHARATASAIMSVRVNFAINHLKVAVKSALDANSVEQANLSVPFGPWFDDMVASVPVAIIMSAAALEANANELIQDVLDNAGGFISASRKELLEDLKKDNFGSSLDRYRKLALLSEKTPSKGTASWQNAESLIEFRNKFMHFKPSWDNEDIHKGKLVNFLKARRVPTVRQWSGTPLIPHIFMTYGCAKWAVQSALDFSSDFASLIGMNDRFTLPGLDFNLP